MVQSDEDRRARIRELNDELRCHGKSGDIVVTAGIAAVGIDAVRRVLGAVAKFANFNEDNDPHGEHDCATLDVDGLSIIWKIDYYDLDQRFHSPDEADPSVTARVLTIMLASEY